ncbi:hypothetical protein EW145_g4590 [Phellinidium pouzarii]|uniref:UBC core domain-containing protein n=1 Tax=Phellinidium pouzarii TaxID=167371 RepID=A0A4S4L3G4_9AGAM|nr:hypothetical protein EW145_g4590 [Phellinidium pouzarii]
MAPALTGASIPGPEGSPYEGGIFKLAVELNANYPFSAPKVTFVTRIYHMNISDRGNICIDVLKENWSPALSLYKVLLSLSSLLTDPNPKDPLVPSIANEYTRNRQKHDGTAREWTRIYALPLKSKETESIASGPPKAKGKSKDTLSESSSRNVGSRTGQDTRFPFTDVCCDECEVINLTTDSDSEGATIAAGERGRARVPTGAKRKRGTEEDIYVEGSRQTNGTESGNIIVIED